MATITSNGTGGGNYSAGASWNGGVAPTAADIASLVGTDDIKLDAPGLVAYSITSVSTATLSCSVTSNWDLTLETAGVLSGPVTLDMSSVPGYSGALWVNNLRSTTTSNGRLDFQAASNVTIKGVAKTRWTQINGAVSVGATNATVDSAVGWQNGDRVVFGTTDPYHWSGVINTDDVGSVTVSGNNISWTGGITYAHQDRGYIGNFSSNIIIGPKYAGDTSVLLLRGPATIDNALLIGLDDCGYAQYGLCLYGGSSNRSITNCAFSDYTHRTFSLYSVQSAVVTSGHCFYTQAGGFSAAIYSNASNYGLRISDSLILDSQEGFQSESSAAMTVLDSVVSGTRMALHSSFVVSYIVSNCKIFSNEWGVNASNSNFKIYNSDIGGLFSADNFYDISAGSTVELYSQDCIFSDAPYDFLIGINAATDDSSARFANKENNPNTQETYTNLSKDTPTIQRDFTTKPSGLNSSIRVNTQTGVRDIEIPFSIPAPKGLPVMTAGYIYRTNGQPVTVEISGLGTTPDTYTCSGADDEWEQIDVALTNDSGADGMLNILVTVESGNAGEVYIGGFVPLTPAAVKTGDMDYWENGMPVRALLSNYVSGTDVLNTQTDVLTLEGSIGKQLTDEVGDIKYIDHSVWVNTELAVNGDGSLHNPFNDFDDAIDFAEAHNIRKLMVIADIEISRQVKNFVVIGVGEPRVTFLNGFSLEGSEFIHVSLGGTYTGRIDAHHCGLDDGFVLNGTFKDSIIGGDLVCVDGSTVVMVNTTSDSSDPSVSMNATGTCNLTIEGHQGKLTIKDCNQATDKAKVSVTPGLLTFDSSCTDGTMEADGFGQFEKETNGAAVTDRVISASQVDIVEGTLTRKQAMRAILSASAGKLSGAATAEIKIRSTDDTKDRITATVDEDGNRTEVVLDVS